uniref:Uncharacterized protein n=1 Tax=Arundo donax TaxID=35708 RepID=A0A0A9MRH2_ARUDO
MPHHHLAASRPQP